jgi:hypothetical protein
LQFLFVPQGGNAGRIGANPIVPTFANDMYQQSSTMPTPLIQGGYTSLILGVQQDATLLSSARKLHFDEQH